MANLAANDRLSLWLQVFNNSKVNGAPYLGDDLPAHRWTWPTDTYMRRRLRILHAYGGGETTTPNVTDNRRDNLSFKPNRDFSRAPLANSEPGIESYKVWN